MEIKNKCAFVIPLHPKHYDYGYTILKDLQNTDADLYFCFTNREDKELFETKLNKEFTFRYVLLSDYGNIQEIVKTNAIVSIKKLYCLSVLYDKYDYISCIDSEIQFLRTTGFYPMMKSIVENKKVCCGKLKRHLCPERKILYHSLCKLTDPTIHVHLQSLSENFTLYTWWSNLPVYDCKIAKHFLQWIKFNNTVDRFVWEIFDDMTYNFFCVLFYEYRLLKIPNCNHSLEFSDSSLVEYTNDNLCKLYWVNKHAYDKNKNYYQDNEFYLVYHLDRTHFPQF